MSPLHRIIPLLVLCAAIGLGSVACKKPGKRVPPPEVSGLAAVPASATVVIAIDVERVVDSPIVARAVEQLLLREPSLREGWEHVRDHCKIDISKIKRVMLAIGPAAQPRAGGPVLMIATGAFAEPDLVACIPTFVGRGGGSLTTKVVEGRSIYQVKDASRTMFFAFGRPDTIVLGTSDRYVAEAVGPGKKALESTELGGWIKRADQNAPIWAAGGVPEPIRKGLVRVTQGKLAAGPTAFTASIDPRDGIKLAVDVVLGSAADAKQLESLAKAELGMLAMAAQIKSLGKIVGKLEISVERDMVRFRIPLSMDDVNHLLSVLDPKGPPAQDSPPANGSATETPPGAPSPPSPPSK